jgi:GT2 family glycosyltransferase
MDISVIIVNWNTRNFLEQCLESLTSAHPSRSTEIIVVDNASSDGSPEMVEGQFPRVRLIRNRENLGFAKANNIGIRESTGRYVALVNSDIKVLGNCLDPLAHYLDQHPDVGNVGPRILNRDMTLQSSCRKFPSLWNNFCEASGLFRLFPSSSFFSTEHMLYSPHDKIVDVDVLVGCFWMVRRETLDRIGLLDEDFFIYAEDVDWCRRCWRAGWRITFFPGVEAIHYRAASSANDPARFAVEQQRAVLHYWAKHHRPLGCFGIRVILFSRHAVRYLLGATVRVVKSPKTRADSRRLNVSGACLEALMSRNTTRRA